MCVCAGNEERTLSHFEAQKATAPLRCRSRGRPERHLTTGTPKPPAHRVAVCVSKIPNAFVRSLQITREDQPPVPRAPKLKQILRHRSMQSPRRSPPGPAPRPEVLDGKELRLLPPVRHAPQAEASPWPERRAPLAFLDPRLPTSRLPLTGNPYAKDDLHLALEDSRCEWCCAAGLVQQICTEPNCQAQACAPSQRRLRTPHHQPLYARRTGTAAWRR